MLTALALSVAVAATGGCSWAFLRFPKPPRPGETATCKRSSGLPITDYVIGTLHLLDALVLGTVGGIVASLPLAGAAIGSAIMSALHTASAFNGGKKVDACRKLLGPPAAVATTAALAAPAGPPVDPTDPAWQLHDAISRGDVARAEALLDEGADPNARHGGISPIAQAAFNERWAILRMLIERGADPDGPGPFGFRALHYASSLGRAEDARALLAAGAHADVRSDSGLTPLMQVVNGSGSIEIARLLLEAGADPLAECPGGTPLGRASGRGAEFRKLLERYASKVSPGPSRPAPTSKPAPVPKKPTTTPKDPFE